MPSTREIAGRTRARARRIANELGYDVHKLREDSDPSMPLLAPERGIAQLMESAQPRVVIDVGANIGQFASGLRESGYVGEIISFEPLPDEHEVLSAKAATDPAWTVAPRCALGAEAGVAQLNVAGNSESSSILPMLELHAENAPSSVYVDSVETPVRRLDDALAELGIDPAGGLLKVDTQGFEAEVLRGAPATLLSVAAAQVEISLAPLYAEQARASELFATFGAAGLELAYIIDGFKAQDGRLLQIDGGFTRFATAAPN